MRILMISLVLFSVCCVSAFGGSLCLKDGGCGGGCQDNLTVDVGNTIGVDLLGPATFYFMLVSTNGGPPQPITAPLLPACYPFGIPDALAGVQLTLQAIGPIPFFPFIDWTNPVVLTVNP